MDSPLWHVLELSVWNIIYIYYYLIKPKTTENIIKDVMGTWNAVMQPHGLCEVVYLAILKG